MKRQRRSLEKPYVTKVRAANLGDVLGRALDVLDVPIEIGYSRRLPGLSISRHSHGTYRQGLAGSTVFISVLYRGPIPYRIGYIMGIQISRTVECGVRGVRR